jgi:hypothetical protein
MATLTAAQLQTARETMFRLIENAERVRRIINLLIEGDISGVALDATMITNLNTAYTNEKTNLTTLVSSLP